MAKRKVSKQSDVLALYKQSADAIFDEYQTRRKAMSFDEYLAIFAKRPRSNCRDAAGYLLDAIDHFGAHKSMHPWGEVVRYQIFDQEFDEGASRLVGQEKAQSAIRSVLEAQVRDGKINRLILLHGPNGSSKSTMVNCLFNGLENYSRMEDGEMFRYRWVFPSRTTSAGHIGFGGRDGRRDMPSFAHLGDDEINATLECEVRDHPLLLLPKEARREIMETALDNTGDGAYRIPDYLLYASPCARCRQVADALMRTHGGDLRKVLAHVQVEPWAMSRRYGRGLVQLGPQMSADGHQRQVTADRNLAALPVELQNMTLFETFGPLVDASGGILSFEDMLKRPLDAYKYLLGSIENQEVSVGQSILRLNSILIATTNDLMLEAFREHHEYQSFRDRLTMIPVPYLTRKSAEQMIYELQLVPNIRHHVSPHAVEVAASWSVLSRLHRPNPENYEGQLKQIVTGLTVEQKADLYDEALVPEGLDDENAALLIDSIDEIASETAGSWQYEGRYGPSPRVIRQVLLAASMRSDFECLSPFAVLDELKILCGKVREFPFLEREIQSGGYHDNSGFVDIVRARLLEWIEMEVRSASGLVDEHEHEKLLGRYISHVSQQVKGEKVFNEAKNSQEDPDESMMRGIEESLGVAEKDAQDYRKGIISRIAGWAIEHPGQRMFPAAVLPGQLRKLKEAYFQKHRTKVAQVARHALGILEGQESRLDQDSLKAGRKLLDNLMADFGYCEACARDGLGRMLSASFKS